MKQFIKHVGLDVHKDTIAVSLADPGRSKARFIGTIAHSQAAITKLIKTLGTDGEILNFCYEAGPCGYGLYRQIIAAGHDCDVIAPTLIPKRAGDKIKTDRRDSLRLAELHRAGELTAIWVPDTTQESIRDLVRLRDDSKLAERVQRQKLLAFLLRHGLSWTGGKSNWTKGFWAWLEAVKMSHQHQQYVLREYMDGLQHTSKQVAEIEKEMERAKHGWTLEPLVDALMAMRGIRLVAAMGILAELGDLSRFSKPSQLMGYLGLIPSEHSSGDSRHQGRITKTGNKHVRRLLVEASWCYRFHAKRTPEIERRASKTPEAVQDIAWKAQKRLCGRYRYLSERGISSCKVVTAVARELCGFIWAIAQEARQPTYKTA